MSCKTLPSIGAMLSLSACLFLAPFIDAHAQAVPSILGAFSGTFSGQDDSCTTHPPDRSQGLAQIAPPQPLRTAAQLLGLISLTL